MNNFLMNYREGKKSADSLGQKILERYNVLTQVKFTTSKAKHDMQYNKSGIQVAIGNSERLKI